LSELVSPELICIEKDWEVEFFSQAFYWSGDLMNSHKAPFALRRADNHRHIQVLCGAENCFLKELDPIC
jgi:hypothetical protein